MAVKIFIALCILGVIAMAIALIDRYRTHKIDKRKSKIREGWEQAAMEAHQNGDDEPLIDFSNEFDKHPIEFEDGFSAERIRELNNNGSFEAARQWRKTKLQRWLNLIFKSK
jgi:hypothetical protein